MDNTIVRVFAATALGLVLSANAQDSVRPEVGKPLQAAQELVRNHKFKEALGKVREADAVTGKSINEGLLVERMRLAAATGAGDAEMAARAFELVSARLAPAERLRVIESIADAWYRAKNYALCVQWSQRFFKEGGSGARVRTLLVQSQYLAGDFAGAARELRAEIDQAEKSGGAPAEEQVKFLVNATLKQGDNDGYLWAMERLVAHYPQRAYWADLLSRLQRKPGFSDRLSLDVYRLSLAAGAMTSGNDYMEMAQLALQAGFAAEAVQVLDKGFVANVLGAGPAAERSARLRTLATQRQKDEQERQAASVAEARAAKDGGALVAAGLRTVFTGERQQGLQLMQEGLARGGLKRENDARLHLAYAQSLSGDAARAGATLREVKGSDGTADLARLWGLLLRRKH